MPAYSEQGIGSRQGNCVIQKNNRDNEMIEKIAPERIHAKENTLSKLKML